VFIITAYGDEKSEETITMAKAYWIATYRSVSNPDALAAYAKLSGTAVTAAGGRILVRGMPAHLYEAGLQQRTVVIEFDSVEQARAAHDTGIRDLGVQHVVNLALHTHEKALPDEAGSIRNLGMTYTHIPVDFQNPTQEDFDQFCAAMEQFKDAPAHVHCIANYRVSAFFYRYRRDVLGWDDAAARAHMDAIWHPEGVWADFINR
jgi:uncharacterized protein (DUF1330 family)